MPSWSKLAGLPQICTAAAAKSLQSCPTLCDPIDGSPLGSSVPGILQARILEWGAISFSNASKWKVKVKLLSCVRLSYPIDDSLPGFSIHGIFQARVLEWGAIAFSENTLDGTKRNGSVKSSRKIPVQHNHQHFPGQKGSVSGIFHCPKDFPVSSHSPVVVPEFEWTLYYWILCPIASLRKRPDIPTICKQIHRLNSEWWPWIPLEILISSVSHSSSWKTT